MDERASLDQTLSFSRRFAVLAAAFAVAGAVLVYVVAGRRGEHGGTLLPDYAVAASSDQTMRGAVEPTRAALTLRGGAEGSFEIVARPSTTAGAKVVAYAFAMGEGEPNAVDAKIEIAPEGSVRIRGRGRALQGAREVRVVIGTASDSIARYDDALARARDGKSDAHVRVLVVPITRE